MQKIANTNKPISAICAKNCEHNKPISAMRTRPLTICDLVDVCVCQNPAVECLFASS